MKPMLAKNGPHPTKLGPKYLTDEWLWQQKLDGDRVLVKVDGTEDGEAAFVKPLNRNGDPRAKSFPAGVIADLARIQVGTWYFDGELLPGGDYWVFDLLVEGLVDAKMDYAYRLDVLERFMVEFQPRHINLLPTARTEAEKRKLQTRVVDGMAEGIVLKHSSLPYIQGRASKMLKSKNTQTVDVVVIDTHVDGKENASIGLFFPNSARISFGDLEEVAHCSLIGKDEVHQGDVIEVEYLYASKDARLVQPRMVRLRDDKRPQDCTSDQLVYKPTGILV